MEWNNAKVDALFTVSGYSVTGKVVSGDEPVPGVDFYLYSEKVASAGCPPPPPSAVKEQGKGKLLCVVQSDAKGEFQFDSVPPGEYTLVPVYHGTQTTYDVSPAAASVHVTHGDYALEAPFRVIGFGVAGKVVGFDGKGIEGATVLVNGVEKALTAKDGSYRLEQFKAGTYDITAKKQNYVFAALNGEKVTPNSASIPEIAVKEVSVCGTLSIVQPPPNVKLGVREVQVRPDGSKAGASKQHAVQANKDGEYCFSLASGSYTITPTVSSSEEKAGLTFSPPSSSIEVASTPIQGINFSQLRITVSGRVICLTSPCDPAISVTLLPTSTTPSSSSVMTTSLDITDNQFFLRDVLPGNYRVAVNMPNDVWCWEVQFKDLNINKDITNIEFVQTGYSLPVTADHDVELHVAHSKDKKKGEITHKLNAGIPTKLCVLSPGSYTLTPKSCFKFGQETFSFDTAVPKAVDLKATRILYSYSYKYNIICYIITRI